MSASSTSIAGPAGAAAAEDDEAAAAGVAGAAASCDVEAEVEAAAGRRPSARFGASAAASAAEAAPGAAASRRTARQRRVVLLAHRAEVDEPLSVDVARGMRQRARSSVAATSGWKSCHSSPACHCHRGPRSVSTVPARFFLSSATASPGMRWCTAPAGWTCSHLSSWRGRTSVGLPPRDVSMTPPSPSGATTHCTRLTTQGRAVTAELGAADRPRR